MLLTVFFLTLPVDGVLRSLSIFKTFIHQRNKEMKNKQKTMVKKTKL